MDRSLCCNSSTTTTTTTTSTIPVHPFAVRHLNTIPVLPYPSFKLRYPRRQPLRILSVAKRTGKQRYPSEKKKLKLKHKEAVTYVKNKFESIWRLSKLAVSVQNDPGKGSLAVSEGLLQEITKVIKFPVASMLPPEAFSVVRKSFDARKMLKEPKFVYTVDMDPTKLCWFLRVAACAAPLPFVGFTGGDDEDDDSDV